MKKWYAVQSGSDYDWDYGAGNLAEATKMANKLACDARFDGEEIRIVLIDDENKVAIDELIVREGTR